ncbi:hypothetical protein EDM54_01520 [Brevibacillus borstelensis]|nr:hypothetical protein EDM54_01520 [Brevibacillus borstelensis]GED53514.1 hypothetical protein BBO01nite_27550 [Brevibacillus borstelensis]
MGQARFESWIARLRSGEKNIWLIYEMCKELWEVKGAAFRQLSHLQKVRLLRELLPGVPVDLITSGYIEYAKSDWNSIPADCEIQLRCKDNKSFDFTWHYVCAQDGEANVYHLPNRC